MPGPLTLIATTDTFRTWFQLTDNIVSLLNTSALVDNVVAFGVFTIGANANTSLAVSNGFFVNTSLILTKTPATLAANVTISANANVFNIASNNVIIQPLQGTTFNSNVVVNSTASFLGPITANSSLSVNGAFSLTGTSTHNGAATFSGGGTAVQQLTFVGNASVVANTMNNPQYNDFNPTGLSGGMILNLTPGIDTVVTGITAPTTVTANGAQVLYLQNLSSTFKITLVSANTSSGANNRFKLPGDLPFDILPGSAATLIWSWSNKEWRTLSTAALVGPQTFANVTVNGTLTVVSTTTLQANCTVPNITVAGGITTNGLSGTGTTNLNILNVAGNTAFGALTTYSSTVKYSGSSARFVIPVGANLWA
jgi:hypothetical protein